MTHGTLCLEERGTIARQGCGGYQQKDQRLEHRSEDIIHDVYRQIGAGRGKLATEALASIDLPFRQVKGKRLSNKPLRVEQFHI
ncbi:MAG: hypothetical protein DMG21_18880 [Acidobacteria bacterium]|nr:MAG: hypothetical protein DMG21_18880 [Acidobacteriota bacterium]